jgi:hypothetical protein
MRRVLAVVAGSLLAAALLADDAAPAASAFSAASAGPQLGDCVIFSEGGAGRLLKAPTYWLKGSIAALSRQRWQLDRCPHIGKPAAAHTVADYARLAAAMPCVEPASVSVVDTLPREVEVTRVQVLVAEWETPWSHQHGTTGWLFRGQFLEQTLRKGALIDMDAAWLEGCEGER